MKIFISWSGEKSREVADSLKQWIPLLLPDCEAWLASSEVEAGTIWAPQVFHAMEQARFGVICLTKANLISPWLLYEAGALTRTLTERNMCLYLIDLNPSEVSGPLAQLQAIQADKNGTLTLISKIREISEPNSGQSQPLNRVFEDAWSHLSRVLEGESERVEEAAMVFADVAGSSRLSATAGDLETAGAFKELFARAEEFRRTIGGEIIKHLGDGFLAVFEDASKAFDFAVELQLSLKNRPILAGPHPLKLRIGIHKGPIQRMPTSYGREVMGIALNMAARLTSIANPGEIVVSGDARAALPQSSRDLLSPSENTVLKHGEQVKISRLGTLARAQSYGS